MAQAFEVHVEEEVLDDMKKRIRHFHWPSGIVDIDWSRGVTRSFMEKLTWYWLADFDWRQVEKKINSYPNYIEEIDGYLIHYLHIKSNSENAIPLVISHGWPGSFLEMMKIIPMLTKDNDISFNLVIPSLIGFGFSDNSIREDIGDQLMAELWVKLMKKLGYDSYMLQGGDFGAHISTWIAMKHPERIIGLHLNYIPFSYKPYLFPGEKLTEEEMAAQQKTAQFFKTEGAYAMIQSNKPVTLSYSLNDSPVGWCAWVMQMFHSFSDQQKELAELFDMDELLANVTLYWVTNTISTSVRIYNEVAKTPLVFSKDDFIKVPVGIAKFPFPDSFPAKKFVERGYNVQYWKDMAKGGHFAAMEQPRLFAESIQDFASIVLTNQLQNVYSVTPGII